jgi:MSHA pilin protein MshA
MKPLARIDTRTRIFWQDLCGNMRAFTLVEFLVAVLFLATVLALAVPRFWSLGSEARSAKQQAIFGSVRAAAQITRAAAQVHNQVGPSGTVTVDGIGISTVFGYPTATPAGIIAATGLDPSADQISYSEGGTAPGSTITVSLNGAHSTCAVVYVSPSKAEEQPSVDFLNSNGRGGAGC